MMSEGFCTSLLRVPNIIFSSLTATGERGSRATPDGKTVRQLTRFLSNCTWRRHLQYKVCPDPELKFPFEPSGYAGRQVCLSAISLEYQGRRHLRSGKAPRTLHSRRDRRGSGGRAERHKFSHSGKRWDLGLRQVYWCRTLPNTPHCGPGNCHENIVIIYD